MGQFFNQPDFATEGKEVVIVTKGQAGQGIGNLNQSCLYVGTGGDITVLIAGTQGGGQPFAPVFFKDVPSGSILPVIVDYVIDGSRGNGPTTASDLIALK